MLCDRHTIYLGKFFGILTCGLKFLFVLVVADYTFARGKAFGTCFGIVSFDYTAAPFSLLEDLINGPIIRS